MGVERGVKRDTRSGGGGGKKGHSFGRGGDKKGNSFGWVSTFSE